jgi:Protein of unknown function (DUF429)
MALGSAQDTFRGRHVVRVLAVPHVLHRARSCRSSQHLQELTNRTGIAVVDGHGQLQHVTAVIKTEDILQVLAPFTSGDCVVAIDAPLLVTNDDTRPRPAEKHLNRRLPRLSSGGASGLQGQERSAVRPEVRMVGRPPRGHPRRVLYTLPFFGADGKPYLLDGYKDIRDRGRFDLWGASTTVYTRIRRGHTPRGGTIAAGELRLSLAEWVRELSTVRVTGTADPIRQVVALLDLGRPFAESLWEVFLRPRIPLLPEQPRRSHDAVTQPAKTIAHLGRRRS